MDEFLVMDQLLTWVIIYSPEAEKIADYLILKTSQGQQKIRMN